MATNGDTGGTLPADPWQAGLAAKKRIEDEMGWWNPLDANGRRKPPRWR